MGTFLALVAIALSFVMMNMPFGPHFTVLGVMLIVLLGAAIFRPNGAWFMASALLVGFCSLGAAPFEAPRAFLRDFTRAARGDGPEAEAAQQTIAFYETLSSLIWPLELAIIAFILFTIVLAARRGQDGSFSFLLKASDAIGEFTVKVGQWTSLVYIPMIIIIFYDVVQRKYLEFNPNFVDSFMFQTFTSTKLQEMQWHLHAILFLLCFGFGYNKDAHVRIELVREKLRPNTRVWIELLGCSVFLIPYCFLIYTYGFEFARKSFDILEGSAALTGLPYRFIIKGFLPVGFVVLALAALAVWLKCIVYLFGPDYLKRQASYYAGTHHADLAESFEPDTSTEKAS
ncbi:MAG: TRAP transporter small permease subunit [Pseudomonadota bacterium]